MTNVLVEMKVRIAQMKISKNKFYLFKQNEFYKNISILPVKSTLKSTLIFPG